MTHNEASPTRLESVLPPFALAGAAVAVLLALWAGDAAATCNVIPPSTAFACVRGALGCAGAPFASPGQSLEIRPTPCDLTSRTLRVDPGDGSSACLAPEGVVVSTIVKPLNGPVSVVVSAASCTPALEAAVDAWRVRLAPGGGTAVCEADPSLAVRRFDLGDGASECRLDMSFPDTTAIAEPRTGVPAPHVGPTAIVVTRAEDPLPLPLDQQRCVDAVGVVPMSRCIDELFETDGTCRTDAALRNALVSDFTALPAQNDFQKLCSTRSDPASPCDDSVSPDLQFALDGRGDVLIPIDWRGVRPVPAEGLPPATVVGLQTAIPGFSGSPDPLQVSEADQVRALTTEGLVLPAPFSPIFDPSDASEAGFTGTTDGPFGVLLVRRTGSSGVPDFDLAYRLAPNGGPGILRGADSSPSAPDFAAFTEGRVPLRGLCRTSELFCFAPDETLDDVSINADSDRTDPSVVTVRSLATGRLEPIGGDLPGGGVADGRAAAFVFRPPFRTVALAARERCLAFLEPELLEGATDFNQNGDVAGSNLRAICVDAAGHARDVADAAVLAALGLPAVAAEADPVLFEGSNGPSDDGLRGDPVLVSNDRIYFRASEAANAERATSRVDVTPAEEPSQGPGSAPDATAAGDVVVFASAADDLADADKNGESDVFVRDLRTGITSLGSVRYADPPPKRPLCEGRLITGRGASVGAAIAPDGASFCYETSAPNLIRFDRNGTWDILVQDRATCETERVSVTAAGEEAAAESHHCAIASGGQRVAFDSLAALAEDDVDAAADVYVRDRAAGTTTLVSVDAAGPLPGESTDPAISADGTRIAFTNATGAGSFVYLRDLATGETLFLGEGTSPDLSADGNLVAFAAPGELATDIWVADLTRGLTEVVSLSDTFEPGSLPSVSPAVSADGGAVSYTTANAFTPGDANGVPDVYQVDLITRLVQRVAPEFDGSAAAVLSGDASSSAFEAADGVGQGVFVREPAGLATDFSGDGQLDDDVLFVLDAGGAEPVLHTVGPARQVAVAGDLFAYVSGEDDRVLLRACPDCPPQDLGRTARAVALSDQVVCAETLPDGVLACRRVAGAGALVDLIDSGGAPVSVDAFAVAGDRVAFRQPGPGAVGSLDVVEVAPDGTLTTAVAGEPARTFVLGATGVVAWNSCEGDVGVDLNGDGFEPEDCVLYYNRPGSSDAVNSFEIVTDCFTDACNPKFPFLVLGDVVRFLTRECRDGGDCADPGAANDRCDKDGDGDCDGVVVQNLDTRRDDLLVLAQVDLDRSQTNPLGDPGTGGFSSVILEGAVFTDFDGDGVLDVNDSCPETPNPLQIDFDADGVGDDCDDFSCGDGTLDEAEFCEPLLAGADCLDDCTPRVPVDVTESAINPDQNGGVPALIFATSLLNLANQPRGDLPPKMIDASTLRFTAVVDGACLPGGAPTVHDLSDPQTYRSHLVDKNGDGWPDLQVHLGVIGSGITSATTEACVTGTFAVPGGEFGTASFESRDAVNVN